MKRIHTLVLFSLIAVLMVAIVGPVAASQDSAQGATTETTAVPEQISQDEGPAVEAPPPDEVVPEQPWTVRFIYPVIVLGTVVLIVGLAIGYNRSIRRKYHVVS